MSSERTYIKVLPSQILPGDYVQLRDGWYTATGPAAAPWMSTMAGNGAVTRIPVVGGLTPIISPDIAVQVARAVEA